MTALTFGTVGNRFETPIAKVILVVVFAKFKLFLTHITHVIFVRVYAFCKRNFTIIAFMILVVVLTLRHILVAIITKIVAVAVIAAIKFQTAYVARMVFVFVHTALGNKQVANVAFVIIISIGADGDFALTFIASMVVICIIAFVSTVSYKRRTGKTREG